jgi:hypothetical protein
MARRWLLLAALGALFAARPAGASPATVPLEVLRTRHIVVPVYLNGAGPFRLVLDTGSPITFISGRAARKLGLITPEAASRPTFMGMRGQTTLKSIRLGGAETTGLSVLVLDHPIVELLSQIEGPIDGIIGFTYFARYKTTIDYAGRSVTLQRTPYQPVDVIPGLAAQLQAKPVPRRVLSPSALWGMIVEQASDTQGVRIAQMYKNSPAAAAGLRAGDRLLTIDARWTDSVNQCYEAVQLAHPNRPVAVEYLRDGETRATTVRPRPGF